MPVKPTPLAERFWAKVDIRGEDECWPWLAGMNGKYGSIGIGGRTGGSELAHRVAYELTYGPLGELHALHSCDNPPCCNPRHLFAGTQLDNMQDKMSKGRGNHAKGEATCHAKLTANTVRRIRYLHARGAKQIELSRLFGVNDRTINAIVLYKTWKHIPARPIRGAV